MIDEHAAAVLALLDADNTVPALVVYDGRVPVNPATGKTNPPPYVVVYFDSNDPEWDKEARPWQFLLTATCHSVGGNAQAARIVADRVRAALLGVAPSVTGRSCHPITREPGAPPQRDESTGTTVMDQVDLYVLRSLPG